MTATGKRIADALKRAALRGVNVYVLIDGYGSKDLPRSMLESCGRAASRRSSTGPRYPLGPFGASACAGCTEKL